MAAFFIALLFAFTVGCKPADPIDRLTATLIGDPYFPSWIFVPIALSVTSEPAQVVSNALEQELSFFGRNPVTNITIVTIRQIRISNEVMARVYPDSTKYTAVLVDTSVGRKIELLQFQKTVLPQFQERSKGSQGGWWYRVYNTKP